MTEIKIKLLSPACKPQRKTAGAVGYDLVARESAFLYQGMTAMVPVGFALELPPGMEAQIRPRSGLNYKGIFALFGTVDSDYRGEVKVILYNACVRSGFDVKPGDRVAQMVITPVAPTELVEVPELSETERGEGGFGSTGLGSSALTAVVADHKELAKLSEPSVQDLLWQENQREAARAWQNAHDPFLNGITGDLNNNTDS